MGTQPRQTCGDGFGAQLAHKIDTYRNLAQKLGPKTEHANTTIEEDK